MWPDTMASQDSRCCATCALSSTSQPKCGHSLPQTSHTSLSSSTWPSQIGRLTSNGSLTLSNDAEVEQLLLQATADQRAGITKPYPPSATVARQLDAMVAHLGRFQASTQVALVGEEEEEELETCAIRGKRVRCFNSGEFRHIARQCRKKRTQSPTTRAIRCLHTNWHTSATPHSFCVRQTGPGTRRLTSTGFGHEPTAQ